MSAAFLATVETQAVTKAWQDHLQIETKIKNGKLSLYQPQFLTLLKGNVRKIRIVRQWYGWLVAMP
jgi:hypothetical protein